MDTTDVSDGCLFGGKADICREFNCHRASPANHSETRPMQKTSMDREVTVKQKGSLIVSPEAYKKLMDDLYAARMWLLRARNTTTNQLTVCEKEAVEHMREIKRIIDEELENPEASVETLAQDLVEIGTDVVGKQKALNRVEMEELQKTLDSLFDTLRSDVMEAKSVIQPEYVKSKQRSFVDLISDYGHWCLYVMNVFIILFVGLYHYLPSD